MDFPLAGSVSDYEPEKTEQELLAEKYNPDLDVVFVKESAVAYANKPAVYETIKASSLQAHFRQSESLISYRTKNEVAKSNVRDIVLEALENDEIDEEVANGIADALGFTLSRSVDVTLSVTVNLTVSVPHGYDIDDLSSDIELSVSTYGSDVEIESEDISIDDVMEG